MSSHRQKSFIAEVTAEHGTFNFLDQLHGTAATLESKAAPVASADSINWDLLAEMRGFKGGRGVGFSRRVIVGSQLPGPRRSGHKTTQKTEPPRDESHYLGHREALIDVPPLHLYFRSVEGGYRLYVRSNVRFGKALFRMSEQCLGASTYEQEGRDPDLFQLLNQDNNRIDPTVIGDRFDFRLALAGQSTPFQLRKFQNNPYTYASSKGGPPLQLSMRILQRNAPYLSAPDEV